MIFSKWNRHDNPVVSIECARVKKSIIYVTVRKQKTPIYILSCSKAPKTQQIAVTTIREKPEDFFNVIHGRRL